MAKSKTQTGMHLNKVFPKTDNQQRVFDNWYDDKHIVISGYAGTGKSLISLYLSLLEVEKGNYSGVTIVRAPIATADIGFLPGTKSEKEAVLKDPYIGLISELYGRGDAFDVVEKKNIVEFTTTAYIRGITLSSRIVIVDECQNLTEHGFDSIITRIGEGSRLILCGDTGQCDLTKEESGFTKTLNILERMSKIAHISMTTDDIVRSGFVKDYIIEREKQNLIRTPKEAEDSFRKTKFLQETAS